MPHITALKNIVVSISLLKKSENLTFCKEKLNVYTTAKGWKPTWHTIQESQVTGVAVDLILSTDWDFGNAVSVTLHKRDAVSR